MFVHKLYSIQGGHIVEQSSQRKQLRHFNEKIFELITHYNIADNK